MDGILQMNLQAWWSLVSSQDLGLCFFSKGPFTHSMAYFHEGWSYLLSGGGDPPSSGKGAGKGHLNSPRKLWGKWLLGSSLMVTLSDLFFLGNVHNGRIFMEKCKTNLFWGHLTEPPPNWLVVRGVCPSKWPKHLKGFSDVLVSMINFRPIRYKIITTYVLSDEMIRFQRFCFGPTSCRNYPIFDKYLKVGYVHLFSILASSSCWVPFKHRGHF